jgi:diguanylate cyclase (GGDEF)-like protein
MTTEHSAPGISTLPGSPTLPRRTTLAGLRERFGVYAITGALALSAAAIVALLNAGPNRAPATPHIEWWMLAALYLIAESFPVHLAVGKETHSFSLSEVPLLLGLFLSTPTELLLGQAVGAGIALIVRRHNSFTKLTFNLASFAFSTSFAIVVFQVVGDAQVPFGPRDLVAGILAALVADFMSGITVQAVIAVSTGEMPDWSGGVGTGAAYVLANATLGLVGTLLITSRPETSWLAGALALAMYGAYRISERQRQRQVRVMGLHEATREVQEALTSENVTHRLLERARQMFGAERAELLVLPHAGQKASLTMVGTDGQSVETTLDRLETTEGICGRVAAEGVGIRMSAAGAPDRLRAWLAGEGIRDLMSAPVRGESGIVAVLTVMNRHGNIGGWAEEEVPLLETLANHAGIALRNGELVAGLAQRAAENEYQARHDALTDLPNRTQFAHLVDAAIGGQPPPTALLSIDLDRFKEINDTLGHANGDEILRGVANRLRAILCEHEVAARLSADEFGLLIWGDDGAHAIAEASGRVQRCLEQAFDVSGLSLNVSATIGAAVVGADGRDAATLLRHADVAMYVAKAAHTPLELYASERDVYSPARLALVGEFRRAIDSGELVAWYQPKISMATQRIIGAEALARWVHPVRGIVRPDEFIPIVEQTNLLRPMTLHILRTAIERFALLRQTDHDIGVSVNLSARNLLDTDVARSIESMLEAVDLPAEALTVEVTESAMMSDPERSIGTLTDLRDLGVHVSIDDFGTGHASLAYLKRLPVNELKIDKSFITHLMTDSSDQSIVRSTIELAHELGLTCVAEGIEDQRTLEWLAAHLCDIGQGYLFGKPMPADDFARLARLDQLGALSVAAGNAGRGGGRAVSANEEGVRSAPRTYRPHGAMAGRTPGSGAF